MTNFRRHLSIKRLNLLLLPVAVLVTVLVVVLILLPGGDGENGLTIIYPPGWEGERTSVVSGDGDGESTPVPSDDGDSESTATPSGGGGTDSTAVPSTDGDAEPTAAPGPSSVEELLEPYAEELIVKQACTLSLDHREVDCSGAGEYRLEPKAEGENVRCAALQVDGTFFSVACNPQGPVSIITPDTFFYVLPQ